MGMSKLRSESLKRAARDMNPKTVPVVVQVKVDGPAFVIDKTTPGVMKTRFSGLSLSPEKSSRNGLRKLAKTAEKVTNRPIINIFPSSNSFLIEASGPDLTALADLDDVGAIFMNDESRGID